MAAWDRCCCGGGGLVGLATLLVKGTEKKNLETPSSMDGPMSCPSSSCTTGFTDVIFRYTV